jgi:Fanconi anemia group M protein
VFIKHRFIKPNSVEYRKFQVAIAYSSRKANSLVVLPTGLGKTIIALFLIAEKLDLKNEKILFLAPTKPLVMQHAQFLKEFLTIDPETISVFTGEISPDKRKKLWDSSKIIVSTPQVIENDILSKRIFLKDICLIVFDESHHAVGEYAYVFVAEVYRKQREKGHILAMTASPGNDVSKIIEVCRNLDITNIEIRTKYDPDVRPYVHELKISWKEIPLPKEFSYTLQLLRKALSSRLKMLKEIGAIESSSINQISRTKLLDAQTKIQMQIRCQVRPSKALFNAASTQSEALKIHYAIELLQTQGVNAIKSYFERVIKEASSKGSSKSSRSIMRDNNVLESIAYLRSLDIEHPKVNEVKKIVKEQFGKNKESRIIIFTHYRDTSSKIFETLEEIKLARPARFIGQATKEGDKGLTQKQQLSLINDFKDGKYNVLIATSVAEEGLDIPSTDLVVFYEPIPSEIRSIQRRGRTGRKMAGNVIILITKGTSDEGYYWASKRKEKRMRSELELLRSKIKKEIENKSEYGERWKETLNQKTLSDYEKKDKDIKIIVDHREYRSTVVRNLTIKGASIEPKQLNVGDYVLSSRIGVERKEVGDYLDSLINGSLFKQVGQLRDAFSRPVLVLEGENLLTQRNISHNAILGSLASITIDFGITILPTRDSAETADLLSVIAKREQKLDKKSVSIRGEKRVHTLSENQQFIVEGLPKVSSVIAKRLLQHFGSIKNLINATEDELMEVQGIGKNISSEIINLINAEYSQD